MYRYPILWIFICSPQDARATLLHLAVNIILDVMNTYGYFSIQILHETHWIYDEHLSCSTLTNSEGKFTVFISLIKMIFTVWVCHRPHWYQFQKFQFVKLVITSAINFHTAFWNIVIIAYTNSSCHFFVYSRFI